MKRSSIYKYDTVWLKGLLSVSIVYATIFILSLVSLIINLEYGKYLNNPTMNQNQEMIYRGDSLLFPIILVTGIIQVFGMFYCMWNVGLWYQSYMKSYDKRKLFNLINIIFSGVVTILFIIDTFIKLLGIFVQIGVFFQHSPKNIIALGYDGWEQIVLKPFIMLPIGFVSAIFYVVMYFLQNHYFKSESYENALEKVQNNYRKIHVDKKRKSINKAKKDLSKKIRVF